MNVATLRLLPSILAWASMMESTLAVEPSELPPLAPGEPLLEQLFGLTGAGMDATVGRH